MLTEKENSLYKANSHRPSDKHLPSDVRLNSYAHRLEFITEAWEDRALALVEIRDVLSTDKEMLASGALLAKACNALREPMATQLDDRRSQITKEAFQTVTVLAKSFAESDNPSLFAYFATIFVAKCLKKAGDAKKAIAQPGANCLFEMVSIFTRGMHKMLLRLLVGCKEKAVGLRQASIHALVLAFTHWDTPGVFAREKALLEEVVMAMLRDADRATRASARCCFVWLFKLFPEREASAVRHLDKGTLGDIQTTRAEMAKEQLGNHESTTGVGTCASAASAGTVVAKRASRPVRSADSRKVHTKEDRTVKATASATAVTSSSTAAGPKSASPFKYMQKQHNTNNNLAPPAAHDRAVRLTHHRSSGDTDEKPANTQPTMAATRNQRAKRVTVKNEIEQPSWSSRPHVAPTSNAARRVASSATAAANVNIHKPRTPPRRSPPLRCSNVNIQMSRDVNDIGMDDAASASSVNTKASTPPRHSLPLRTSHANDVMNMDDDNMEDDDIEDNIYNTIRARGAGVVTDANTSAALAAAAVAFGSHGRPAQRRTLHHAQTSDMMGPPSTRNSSVQSHDSHDSTANSRFGSSGAVRRRVTSTHNANTNTHVTSTGSGGSGGGNGSIGGARGGVSSRTRAGSFRRGASSSSMMTDGTTSRPRSISMSSQVSGESDAESVQSTYSRQTTTGTPPRHQRNQHRASNRRGRITPQRANSMRRTSPAHSVISRGSPKPRHWQPPQQVPAYAHAPYGINDENPLMPHASPSKSLRRKIAQVGVSMNDTLWSGRVEAIESVNTFLQSEDPRAVARYINKMLEVITTAINDTHYKVSLAGLHVLQCVISKQHDNIELHLPIVLYALVSRTADIKRSVKTQANIVMTLLRQCMPGDLLARQVTTTCFSHVGRITLGCIETMKELIPQADRFYNTPANLARVIKQCAVIAGRVKKADVLQGCFTLVEELFRRDGTAFTKAMGTLDAKYGALIGRFVAHKDHALSDAMKSSFLMVEEEDVVDGVDDSTIDENDDDKKSGADTDDVGQVNADTDVDVNVDVDAGAYANDTDVVRDMNIEENNVSIEKEDSEKGRELRIGARSEEDRSRDANIIKTPPTPASLSSLSTLSSSASAVSIASSASAFGSESRSGSVCAPLVSPAYRSVQEAEENHAQNDRNDATTSMHTDTSKPEVESVGERMNAVVAANRIRVPAASNTSMLPSPSATLASVVNANKLKSDKINVFIPKKPTTTTTATVTKKANQQLHASFKLPNNRLEMNMTTKDQIKEKRKIKKNVGEERVVAPVKKEVVNVAMPMFVDEGEAQRLFSCPLSPSKTQFTGFQAYESVKPTTVLNNNVPLNNTPVTSTRTGVSTTSTHAQPIVQYLPLQRPSPTPVAPTPAAARNLVRILPHATVISAVPDVVAVDDVVAEAAGAVHVTAAASSTAECIPTQRMAETNTSSDESVVEPVGTPSRPRVSSVGQVSQRIAFFESSASKSSLKAPMSSAAVQAESSPVTVAQPSPVRDIGTFIDALGHSFAPVRMHALDDLRRCILGNKKLFVNEHTPHDEKKEEDETTICVLFGRVVLLLDDRNVGVRRSAAYCAASLLDQTTFEEATAVGVALKGVGNKAHSISNVAEVCALFEAMEFRHQRLVVSCSSNTTSEWSSVSVAGRLVLRRT